jgi:nuclease S1
MNLKAGVRITACLLSLIIVRSALPQRAHAWGNVGHQIVGRIAGHQISKTTRDKINEILKNDFTIKDCAQKHLPTKSVQSKLACISTWADSVRFGAFKETYNWHFVDILLSDHDYVPSRDCVLDPEKGDCVIAALDRLKDIVSGKTTDPKITKAIALKFIVHFVGDLHQPLHAVKDGGGENDVKITWFNTEKTPNKPDDDWNLHQVWDTFIITNQQKKDVTYALQLVHKLPVKTSADYEQLVGGTPTDWALASHELANANAIPTLPATKDSENRFNLGKPYFNANKSTVDDQLMKGGARLARFLDDALK